MIHRLVVMTMMIIMMVVMLLVSAWTMTPWWYQVWARSTDLKRTNKFYSCIHVRNQHETALLVKCLMLISCLAYFLTLKMEATCSPKMSVAFQQTTWHYIPEDRTLHDHWMRTSNPRRVH
jgi:hypothetical protein